MFERFIQLIVQMSEPELALIGGSSLSSGFNDLSYLDDVLFPQILVLQEVNIHKLNNHINDRNMNLSESSVFRNELSCLGLNLLGIVLNFNRILPSD